VTVQPSVPPASRADALAYLADVARTACNTATRERGVSADLLDLVKQQLLFADKIIRQERLFEFFIVKIADDCELDYQASFFPLIPEDY
jgi:hypothetical protein